jgi:hypothetical protein
VLLSHYFALKIVPFVPEAKKWTGTRQLGYQDEKAIKQTTSFNLRLAELVPGSSYPD